MTSDHWIAIGVMAVLLIVIELQVRKNRRENDRIRRLHRLPDSGGATSHTPCRGLPGPQELPAREPHDWKQDDLPLWALDWLYTVRELPQTEEPVK